MIFPPALIQAAVPQRQGLAMGTVLRLESSNAAALEAAWAECERIEAATSTWRPNSTWSRLNAAKGVAFPMDREWIELLSKAQVFAARSGGTFDPVLGALLGAWGVRSGGRAPNPAELEEARKASGVALLKLDPGAGTAQLLHSSAGVEEGGFVKGYALDRMAEAMRKAGASSGLLDLGGQLLAFGPEPRSVAVADARHRDRARLRLRLKDASLATSGFSERGAHILDPRTGRPCADWGSVSVVAATGLEADLLTKPCFVLGPREGFAWAEREGVAACFQLKDRRLRMTKAFRALLRR